MKQNLSKSLAMLSLMGCAFVMQSCSESDDHTCPEQTQAVESIINGQLQIPISALAGEKLITISPNGDWKLAVPSEITWLTAEPLSGTSKDKEIKLTLNENVKFDTRQAQLTFTVGNSNQVMTVTQEATKKSIVVYVDDITVSSTKREMILERIITNVDDIEIVQYPEWISSATVTKVVDGAFMATLQMKSGDYDTADRDGQLVIKEKGSDFAVSYDMKALKSREKYIVDGPSEIGAYHRDGYVIFSVDVANSPTASAYELQCFEYNKGWGTFANRPMDGVEIIPQISEKAAYGKNTFTVKIPNYVYNQNEDWDDEGIQPRTIGLFAVPSDVEGYNPNDNLKGALQVKQQQQDPKKIFVFTTDETNTRPMYDFSITEEVRHSIKVKSKSYIGYAFGEMNRDPHSATNCGITPNPQYSVTQTSVSEPDEEGYIHYEFSVYMPVGSGSAQINAFLDFVEADVDGNFVLNSTRVNMFIRVTYKQMVE